MPPRPRFEVASVKPCKNAGGIAPDGSKGGHSGGVRSSPGSLYLGCQKVEDLIRFAYLGYADGKPWAERGLPGIPGPPISSRLLFAPIAGIPKWARSNQYTIEAKASGPQSIEMMRGPMMQVLLEERFRLKISRETKDVPVYLLTVDKGGPKLQEARKGSCTVLDFGHPASPPVSGQHHEPICGMFNSGSDGRGIDTYGQTIAGLCDQFSAYLDRDVLDKTGIRGRFDIHFDSEFSELFPNGSPTPVSGATPSPMDPFPAISSELQKLGLRLESAKQSARFIVVEHIERPMQN